MRRGQREFILNANNFCIVETQSISQYVNTDIYYVSIRFHLIVCYDRCIIIYNVVIYLEST